LVQIREYARSEPERPAHEVIEPLRLSVVAQRSGQAPATMTIGSDLGGKSHAWAATWLVPRMVPPFWRTRRFGWLSLQTFLEGVHFAFHLHL
jgi:hypothetical protein